MNKVSFSKVAIVISILVSIFISFYLRDQRDWRNVVDSDGRGYYAFLPATFIYHDFSFAFLDTLNEKIKNETNAAYLDFLTKENGYVINRFYTGTALLILPFFLIAHILSYMCGYAHNGYSLIYMYGVFVSGIFYFMLGLIFLRKFLKTFGLSELSISVSIIAIVLGTNLLFYSSLMICLSHVYSFFLITAFVYYTRKAIHNYYFKYILIAGLLIGLIVLVRPVNIMIVASLPFIAGKSDALINLFKNIFSRISYLLISIAIFCGICFIQLIANKLSTGFFFVYNYGHTELTTFHFDHPHFTDVLFSYRKGLFIYTPLCFVVVAMSVVLIFRQPFQFVSFFLFFLFITFIISSWGYWDYGGGYGMRPYIEFFSLFALVLATGIDFSNRILKVLLCILVFCTIYYSIIQTYQMRFAILHYAEMNKDRYWEVFLKTDAKLRAKFFREEGEHFQLNEAILLIEKQQGINPINSTFDTLENNTKHPDFSTATKIDGSRIFSETVEINLSPFQNQKQQIRVDVSFWAYTNTCMNNPMCVCSFEQVDQPQWMQIPVNGEITSLKKWQKVSVSFFPKIFVANKNSVLTIYVLNFSDAPMYLGEMDVKMFKKKS